MCVALPGKVIEMNVNLIRNEIEENIVKADSGLVDVSVGDNVLVHAGCVIQKMDQSMVDEMKELFDEIEGLTI